MTADLDPRGLFSALAEAGVAYILIGGWAVNAHGYVRVTQDVDICPDPGLETVERLAGLLQRLNARLLGTSESTAGEPPADPHDPQDLAQGGNFRVGTDLGVLDVMQWVDSTEGELHFTDLSADAMEARPWGIPVRVCSRERLIAMKRRAGRPVDEDDLAHLVDDP